MRKRRREEGRGGGEGKRGGREISQKGDKTLVNFVNFPLVCSGLMCLCFSWTSLLRGQNHSFVLLHVFSSQKYLLTFHNSIDTQPSSKVFWSNPRKSALAFPSLSTQSSGKSYSFHHQKRPQFYPFFSIYTVIA